MGKRVGAGRGIGRGAGDTGEAAFGVALFFLQDLKKEPGSSILVI